MARARVGTTTDRVVSVLRIGSIVLRVDDLSARVLGGGSGLRPA
jgi:hypothetical protein